MLHYYQLYAHVVLLSAIHSEIIAPGIRFPRHEIYAQELLDALRDDINILMWMVRLFQSG